MKSKAFCHTQTYHTLYILLIEGKMDIQTEATDSFQKLYCCFFCF